MASLRRIIRTFAAPLDLGLPHIAGDALVIGSAPGARPPDGRLSDWTIISVNASQIIALDWGSKIPDFTILRDMSGRGPEDLKAREILAGRAAKTVVASSWSGDRKPFDVFLTEIGFSASSLTVLTEWQKQHVLYRTCRATSIFGVGKLEVSNGIWAAVLAVFLGARKVAMTGISFTRNGHAYDTAVHARAHIDKDKIALGALSSRSGKVFAVDPAFSQELGIPLLAGDRS